MIITGGLLIPPSPDIIIILLCVCVVRKILNIFKIHSLGNFLVYNTVFTVIPIYFDHTLQSVPHLQSSNSINEVGG